MQTDTLSPYRPRIEQIGPWSRIDADDAFAKAEIVKAEIEAMGVAADVADLAANAFVWGNGGHIAGESLLEIRASAALTAWKASKAAALTVEAA